MSTPSTLVRISVSFCHRPVRAWQPVELRYTTYQKLLDRLDVLTTEHLAVSKHHLDVDFARQDKLTDAIGIIMDVVDKALAEEPNPDELRLEDIRELGLTAA
jgi:hypothetical protein